MKKQEQQGGANFEKEDLKRLLFKKNNEKKSLKIVD